MRSGREVSQSSTLSPQARLIAVDHVHIEAPRPSRDELMWFYGELVGLRAMRPWAESPAAPAADDLLRYRGERFELHITLAEEPRVEPVDTRVQLEIRRPLEETAELLEERGHPYEWQRGLAFTDRALALLDPAGNRVVLRKMWGFQPI